MKKFVFTSDKIALRIKEYAKKKNISTGEMLLKCDMNKNALSTMSLGSMPMVDNLAKIADYLNVSIDYLIGRTDNPEVNK